VRHFSAAHTILLFPTPGQQSRSVTPGQKMTPRPALDRLKTPTTSLARIITPAGTCRTPIICSAIQGGLEDVAIDGHFDLVRVADQVLEAARDNSNNFFSAGWKAE